jgi:hypothetical protein
MPEVSGGSTPSTANQQHHADLRRCKTGNQQQQADSTPPPALTSTVSWKALAWSKAAWPMEPSITKITCCGLTAAWGKVGRHTEEGLEQSVSAAAQRRISALHLLLQRQPASRHLLHLLQQPSTDRAPL